jgi:hypothetical protein
MKLTGQTALYKYTILSKVWKQKPDIDFPLNFTFRHLWKWRFPETLWDVSLETFIKMSKYTQETKYAGELLTEIYSGKLNKGLAYKVIMTMPIKKILPVYEHYLKNYTNIAEVLEKQSELCTKKQPVLYDMEEFGLTNIAMYIAHNNRQMCWEYVMKQSVSWVVAEYRREIKSSENQIFAHEQMIKKQ